MQNAPIEIRARRKNCPPSPPPPPPRRFGLFPKRSFLSDPNESRICRQIFSKLISNKPSDLIVSSLSSYYHHRQSSALLHPRLPVAIGSQRDRINLFFLLTVSETFPHVYARFHSFAADSRSSKQRPTGV